MCLPLPPDQAATLKHGNAHFFFNIYSCKKGVSIPIRPNLSGDKLQRLTKVGTGSHKEYTHMKLKINFVDEISDILMSRFFFLKNIHLLQSLLSYLK